MAAGSGRTSCSLIDGSPALNIVGVILILGSEKRARFGDRVAGTRGSNPVRCRGNLQNPKEE